MTTSTPHPAPAPSVGTPAVAVTGASAAPSDGAVGAAGEPGVGSAGRSTDASVPGRVDPGGVWAVRRYAGPVGELVLVAGRAGLAAVLWPGDDRPVRVGGGVDARTLVLASGSDSAPEVRRSAAVRAEVVLDETVCQLDEYFAGARHSFELPLDPTGTEFQVAVWQSLVEIGYGETATYGEQAARLGRPSAVRAVGAATGRNPLSIVVPCHRVVGRDGRLTGFAGGLDAKAFLLEHEARHRRD